jgi:hypothetical protein
MSRFFRHCYCGDWKASPWFDTVGSVSNGSIDAEQQPTNGACRTPAAQNAGLANLAVTGAASDGVRVLADDAAAAATL